MVRYFEKIPPFHWWALTGALWLMSASAAFALPSGGKVLRIGANQSSIAVSHPDMAPWQPRDRVCVIQLRSTIGCGRVVKSTTKGAIVRLDAPSADVIAGDTVVAESQATSVSESGPGPKSTRTSKALSPKSDSFAAENQSRKPSQIGSKTQLLDSVKKHPESEAYNFNLSAGTSISFSFFYPILNFQYSFSPQFAVGVVPMALFAGTSSASLTGLGGYVTLNYYGQGNFRGLWIQGGAGMVMFNVSGGLSTSESANTLAAIGTVGWRGYWDLGLNIGVGAGLQYIQNPSFTSITVESAGFLPMVILDVGFNW
jgi:hypothetical protein